MGVNVNEAWGIIGVLISILRELRLYNGRHLIEHIQDPRTFGWPGYRWRRNHRTINNVKAFLAFPTPFVLDAQFRGSCKFINDRLGFLSFSVTSICIPITSYPLTELMGWLFSVGIWYCSWAGLESIGLICGTY